MLKVRNNIFSDSAHNFSVCLCACQACGRTSQGHTGGRSHMISHSLSFCGACLIFSCEKDSAVPFTRRP